MQSQINLLSVAEKVRSLGDDKMFIFSKSISKTQEPIAVPGVINKFIFKLRFCDNDYLHDKHVINLFLHSFLLNFCPQGVEILNPFCKWIYIHTCSIDSGTIPVP